MPCEIIFFTIKNKNWLFVIPPLGTFEMGSNNGLPIETPVHLVNISQHIAILQTPVTQHLYSLVLGENPSFFKGDLHPVESVSWHDAKCFCTELSKVIGKNVRLLTEAEWEYICRAGVQCEYFFGDNAKQLKNYSWFDNNSLDSTHPVAEKKSNSWSFFDITGNVWEWCEDVFVSNYGDQSKQGLKRVVRGGAFDMDEYRLRSAYRSCEFPEMQLKQIGFRVAVEL